MEALVKHLAFGRLADGRFPGAVPWVEQAALEHMQGAAAVLFDLPDLDAVMRQVSRQVKLSPAATGMDNESRPACTSGALNRPAIACSCSRDTATRPAGNDTILAQRCGRAGVWSPLPVLVP